MAPRQRGTTHAGLRLLLVADSLLLPGSSARPHPPRGAGTVGLSFPRLPATWRVRQEALLMLPRSCRASVAVASRSTGEQLTLGVVRGVLVGQDLGSGEQFTVTSATAVGEERA